jgi:hypothetical protein
MIRDRKLLKAKDSQYLGMIDIRDNNLYVITANFAGWVKKEDLERYDNDIEKYVKDYNGESIISIQRIDLEIDSKTKFKAAIKDCPKSIWGLKSKGSKVIVRSNEEKDVLDNSHS